MFASALKRMGLHSTRDTDYLTGWITTMLDSVKTNEEQNQILQNVYGYLWYLTTAKPTPES